MENNNTENNAQRQAQQPVRRKPQHLAPSTQRATAKAQHAAKTTLPKQTPRQVRDVVTRFQRGANYAAVDEAIISEAMPVRLVYNALGQLLYRVGLQTEYFILRIWRAIKQALSGIKHTFTLLFSAAKAPLKALFAGIWYDLAMPIIQIFTGVTHAREAMHEAKKQGEDARGAGLEYLKGGVKTYRRLMLSAASYALPLIALAIMVVTVMSVLSANYSLKVTYDGAVIGFIQNETVWESAQTLIRSRIKASNSTQEWKAMPVFNVVSVDKAALSTASTLADAIVAQSPEKVQQATGLYVDDALYAVVPESTELQEFLNYALDNAAAQSPEGRAEYVHSMQSIPGLYFTDSLTSLSNAEQRLRNENMLQVKTIINSTYTEALEYETQDEETEELYQGVTRIVQQGANGEREVNADIVYIDGVEVERRILSETVLREAVPRIRQVGTKELNFAGSIGAVGSGVFTFPVPGYSYITTEFGQGGHRGIDICAPYGTPVYACDSGTVIEAGSHYSWGNYVKIDHGNGMATLYAHNSTLLVSAGQTVSRGDAIALVGSTGASSGNHCHLEVYVNGGLVNPRNYIF